MYRNSEGYADPTVGAALSHMGKVAAMERREYRRKKAMVMARPKVYVVSPFAGDIENNVRQARRYCRFAASKNAVPVASHLLYPQFLRDNDPRERELGLLFGLALLKSCKEVWCFGNEKSKGMQQELEEAARLGKTIRYFSTEMEEIE